MGRKCIERGKKEGYGPRKKGVTSNPWEDVSMAWRERFRDYGKKLYTKTTETMCIHAVYCIHETITE